MTTEQAYNDFLNELSRIYERQEAANISDWIFENVTGLQRMERSFQRNIELSVEVLHRLKSYQSELLENKPVQYVLNEAWFYKLKFYVNEHVLIPRPETEEIVEWIIDDVRGFEDMKYEFKLLDVGTGSGCIPISLKTNLRDLQITGIDVSRYALEVANSNANLLQTEINFLQLDFLDEKTWNSLAVYDIIVSNPPYIPIAEKNILAKNVTEFEPDIALFVKDSEPFIFYEKIAKFAASHLKLAGKVYVEIHENYCKEVQEIFSSHNFNTEMKKDIYGKERMIKAFRI